MSTQKEFVKAVMASLRLEQNIYIIAAVENMTSTIEVKNYTNFVSYLGARNGSFEKPIQAIANAVDEFNQEITSSLCAALNEKYHTIQPSVRGAVVLITKNAMTKAQIKKMDERDEETRGKWITTQKGIMNKVVESMDGDMEYAKTKFYSVGAREIFDFVRDNGISITTILSGVKISSSSFCRKVSTPSVTHLIFSPIHDESAKRIGVSSGRVRELAGESMAPIKSAFV